jgi:mono/diheme cytochrome c family protein
MSDEAKSNCPSAAGEPTATAATVPMWIIVLLLMLLFLGGVYFDYRSGWFNANVYGPYASAEQLDLYQPKSGAAAQAAHGKQVYDFVCGTCHGNDGLGKPNQAPPLAGSEWVIAPGIKRLARIPITGLSGPLTVMGKEWNLNMAPMGAALTDADLAAVLTYIRTSWGNKASEVTADDIKAVRAELGARPTPLTGDQLKAIQE